MVSVCFGCILSDSEIRHINQGWIVILGPGCLHVLPWVNCKEHLRIWRGKCLKQNSDKRMSNFGPDRVIMGRKILCTFFYIMV